MNASDSVVFSEVDTPGGFRFGIATLNLPATLNSLTFEMIRGLQNKFDLWSRDPKIAFIFLQGSGEKAFCAGGDIRRLYESISSQQLEGAEEFFYHEYRLDHWIHQSPKPVVVWGNGIVMGGGMGLMTGAAFRIVTENSKLAMPEISIGLFPDVGATYFLNKMPGRLGLFLALTAIRVTAGDAKALGLADYSIAHAQRELVMKSLSTAQWSSDATQNRGILREILRPLNDSSLTLMPTAEIWQNRERIDAALKGADINQVADNFAQAAEKDPWLQRPYATFSKGSPTSAAVIFEQLKRGGQLSLAEVFQKEFEMASQFARHHDLREGIRALIIDKDNAPKWNPSSLRAVSASLVEEHLVSPWSERKALL